MYASQSPLIVVCEKSVNYWQVFPTDTLLSAFPLLNITSW